MNYTSLIISALFEQTKKHFKLLAAIYSLSLFSLLGIVYLSWKTNHPIGFFTKDPVSVLFMPVYTGLLSNFGILLWCSATALCGFTYLYLRKVIGHPMLRKFFLSSFLLSLLLTLDDFFLIHEGVFPQILHISESVMYLVYSVSITYYFIRFRSTIINSDFLILLSALSFFALSIFFDKYAETHSLPIDSHLLEDGFKFLGIAGWLTYYSRTCFAIFFKHHS